MTPASAEIDVVDLIFGLHARYPQDRQPKIAEVHRGLCQIRRQGRLTLRWGRTGIRLHILDPGPASIGASRLGSRSQPTC